MLVECGLLRVELSDGRSVTFRPSLGRIAALASPMGRVEIFVRLHGASSVPAACEVLSGLCDPGDLEHLPDLIGGPEATQTGITWVGGQMPDAERVILAQHLLLHGMVGKARPGSNEKGAQGSYSEAFEAGEYIAAARVHLGMSREEAEALSMTELQQLLETKFPDQKKAGAQDIPSRGEYEAGMRAFEELKARRAAGKADHG